MKIAVLSTVAWRTPPAHYGPWEQVAYNIAEGMAARGLDVTLFATKNSYSTARVDGVIEKGYEEDKGTDAKVAECLHISYLMEQASSFDIIHNNFDFLPLSYSKLISTPVVTTIHGFSSEKIIPVYKKYNDSSYYISISNADRHPSLNYEATIYHGLKKEDFAYVDIPEDYLLFFGRIHPHKGTHDAIQIAKKSKKKLVIAGIIQDENYFKEKVEPFINNDDIIFVGQADALKRKQLLGNTIALLHPIYFNEPFGLSVAEAMFCGTPVIAYAKGSMPELVQHNLSGFLVNNVDEATEAVQNIRLINRKYCYAYATEKFGFEKMISEYIKVYNKIAGC